MRLLLVEDDTLLGDGVSAGLQQSGYAVDWVKDGRAAQLALEAGGYDLMVLDLGLPRLSGLELLKWLRGREDALPVLVLTARDTVADRVRGLDSGADDYLVKPFDLDELSARVRALLRRHAGRAAPLLRHGELVLDPAAHRVTRAGKPVALPPREFAILHLLLSHSGRVLSRERLEQSLYGWNEEVESNAIEVHVHHLRKKFGAELIRTVRGVGYMIERMKDEG
ncbi:MAG: response regulator [Pseudomonadota bacterium]|jgi:DNA-binding response OmpR family regulator